MEAFPIRPLTMMFKCGVTQKYRDFEFNEKGELLVVQFLVGIRAPQQRHFHVFFNQWITWAYSTKPQAQQNLHTKKKTFKFIEE